MNEEKKTDSDAEIFKTVAMEKIADTIVPIIYFSWGMITGIITCIVLWAGWN
tara:strand:- start:158 stop:313 length:156 start_codon:yes stop_codon:yes gene_type:complete